MSKPLNEMTIEELVDWATAHIHTGLLYEGGKGMQSAVWTALNTAIAWDRNKETKKKGKKK